MIEYKLILSFSLSISQFVLKKNGKRKCKKVEADPEDSLQLLLELQFRVLISAINQCIKHASGQRNE